jgi:DNA-binding response OmpR family regulator
MKRENERGKLLLVDNNQSIIGFLKTCAEKSGYHVSTLSNLRQLDETAVLLRRIKLDLVVISSMVASESPGAVPKLRMALGCPVIVYAGNSFGEPSCIQGSWRLNRSVVLNTILN